MEARSACHNCNTLILTSLASCPMCFAARVPGAVPTQLGFPESIVPAVKRVFVERYLQFSGRAGILEFWSAYSVYLAGLILIMLTHVAAVAYGYILVCALPLLACKVRRLRDAAKDWSYLGLIFTGIGNLYLWYLFTLPSAPLVDDGSKPDPL